MLFEVRGIGYPDRFLVLREHLEYQGQLKSSVEAGKKQTYFLVLQLLLYRFIFTVRIVLKILSRSA